MTHVLDLPAALDGEIDIFLCNRSNVGVCNEGRGISGNNVGKDQVSSSVLLDIIAVNSTLAGPLQSCSLDCEVATGGISELDPLLSGRRSSSSSVVFLRDS